MTPWLVPQAGVAVHIVSSKVAWLRSSLLDTAVKQGGIDVTFCDSRDRDGQRFNTFIFFAGVTLYVVLDGDYLNLNLQINFAHRPNTKLALSHRSLGAAAVLHVYKGRSAVLKI